MQPASARPGPVLRLLSSIWFGTSVLVLVLIYASILSAVPSVRGAMEVSEMQAFQHWIFVGLILLFAVSLSVATWRRIRWNVVNAGVLMVHSGLLLLTLGSVVYFGSKIEGDVVLITPRVELLTAQGDPIRGGELRAEPGQVWRQNMPAFGGRIEIKVVSVEAGPVHPIQRARLQVSIGQQAPMLVDLDADEQPYRQISGMIARLVTPPPQDTFYVDEDPVLRYTGGDGETRSTPLDGLPMHRERYLDTGTELQDRDGVAVASKRTHPHVRLAGIEIPTGWFEPWRLPIRPETPGLPFDVEITGYVPYVAGLAPRLADGGSAPRPALELSLLLGEQKLTNWLIPDDPKQSMLQTAVPFEMHWVTSEAEVERLLAPLDGPHELVVEVADPPVTQTYSIEEGQRIEVPGTTYTLEIERFMPTWPLMSPGFEGAVSPAASVNVDSGKLRYNRTVIQRFPDLSQDIDEQGVRHTDGPYDGNLTLRYRTRAQGWVYVLGGPDRSLEVVVRDPDGTLTRYPLEVGVATAMRIRGVDLQVRAERLLTHARELLEPVLEPLATRRPNVAMRSRSAIRLKLTGRDRHAGWQEERWIRFSSYPNIDAFPIDVRPPGSDESWQLVYSRRGESLGANLIPKSLTVQFFPGRNSVESWRSDFFVQEESGEVRPAAVYTNQTATVGRWTLFQSGADPDHWRYTVIGIGSRRGIWPMGIGCLLITVGCLYAFYVKPVLKRRKRSEILAASRATAAEIEAAPAEKPEYSEVTS